MSAVFRLVSIEIKSQGIIPGYRRVNAFELSIHFIHAYVHLIKPCIHFIELFVD